MASQTIPALACCAMLAAACSGGAPAARPTLKSLAPAVPAASFLPADAAGAKQILFGDLHVHSTYSVDAFMMNLPVFSGEGVRPLSEACDYARFCSGLDFWATTEHAEGLTGRVWHDVKDQMRACQAAQGDETRADTIVFTGFEWTQLGSSPANQYGHKNVIFKHLDDARLPARPIAMGAFPIGGAPGQFNPVAALYLLPALDPVNGGVYATFGDYLTQVQRLQTCPAGIDTRKLPLDCQEVAANSGTLFEKLAQWDLDTLVIPHGNTWGLHVPQFSDWNSQLTRRDHSPRYQRLIEVYSGHGNSESWRPFEDAFSDGRSLTCPAPTPGYLACCWRAGEIVESRCDDPASAACRAEVDAARQRYLEAGQQGFQTLNVSSDEWLDCGQCRDCFLPAFNYRPNASVQRALAVSTSEGQAADKLRYTFGFIGSSDSHRSSPGAGIVEDRSLVDGTAPRSTLLRAAMNSPLVTPALAWEFERQSSFWLTGGLAAVHAAEKSRDGIWDALQRRETYATSGPRILLWFDLLQGGSRRPMGSVVTAGDSPRFEVRAAGAFRQKPGCPADDGAEEQALRERICRGNCYHPTDERYRITRIEVVRITPQIESAEPMSELVSDPWKVIPCEDRGDGCRVVFEDPDYGARSTLYYVRAIQEATPAVNGGLMRCEYDADGRCLKVNPCYGDDRTAADDQCFSAVEERAWSSPIFLEPR